MPAPACSTVHLVVSPTRSSSLQFTSLLTEAICFQAMLQLTSMLTPHACPAAQAHRGELVGGWQRMAQACERVSVQYACCTVIWSPGRHCEGHGGDTRVMHTGQVVWMAAWASHACVCCSMPTRQHQGGFGDVFVACGQGKATACSSWVCIGTTSRLIATPPQLVKPHLH